MVTDLDILIIGAMLHDIGKFCQRAERPYSKEMEGEVLPSYKGRSSHWHALYTDYFIEQDLPLPGDLEQKRSQIARVAAAHHRPDADKILEMFNPQCLSGN
ncbi:MAG: HD domain-containing protein [Desulfobacterales bacterium]